MGDVMSKCHQCGKADLVAGRGTVEYRQSGLPYPVLLASVPVRRCPACGEEAITVPDPEGLHRALALHVVRARRPLHPKEVRFLRKYLDWNAGRLSAVVGVDPKTVSRWENGRQKVGPVAERLLRLLVLQRLEADARAFTDEVLARLGQGTIEPGESVRLSSSRAGWREAA
jgi:putative zinc finger/helix-turn-helix YgiT family protein